VFPNMRTPAVVVVLLVGLGACGDTAAPHGANLQTLSSAQYGACGRSETQLRCWGSQGNLTGGTSSATPVQPSPPISNLELVRSSPFDEGGCGLDGGGALFCWGYGGSGYKAVAPGLRFTDVTLGQGFQCALATSGVVYCWGHFGNTGVSEQDTAVKECGRSPHTYPCVPEPSPIASAQRFKAVASGWYHTCAVAQSGQVFCWGGITGAGPDLQTSQTPVPVESTERFSAISSGVEGSCAINTAGQPFCWGSNYGGMLGSSEYYLNEPTAVELPAGVAMRAISLGYSHTCSLDTSGIAWCWGTGDLQNVSSISDDPVQVLGGLTFTSLAAGGGFTCGVSGNGAWCWGENGAGQLGNGGSVDSPIPVRVAGQDQFDD
jgi:alpha-tubulin suppressor-like RCC1 family protein